MYIYHVQCIILELMYIVWNTHSHIKTGLIPYVTVENVSLKWDLHVQGIIMYFVRTPCSLSLPLKTTVITGHLCRSYLWHSLCRFPIVRTYMYVHVQMYMCIQQNRDTLYISFNVPPLTWYTHMSTVQALAQIVHTSRAHSLAVIHTYMYMYMYMSMQ